MKKDNGATAHNTVIFMRNLVIWVLVIAFLICMFYFFKGFSREEYQVQYICSNDSSSCGRDYIACETLRPLPEGYGVAVVNCFTTLPYSDNLLNESSKLANKVFANGNCRNITAAFYGFSKDEVILEAYCK